MALDLTYQTKEEFAARFWDRLRLVYSEDKFEFAKRVWWLSNRIADGDFTSNQVRLSFNDAYGRSLNPSQWTVFTTTRLVPIRDRYQAILDEADL